jgi:DNA (cytosine-5)-methyltransferase 1
MTSIKVIGLLDMKGKDQWKRVYDREGISPTLVCAGGGYHEPKVLNMGDSMKTIKVNDLFCGAGGMGIGFKQAGFETAGAWDFDKYAVQAYSHNVDSIVKQANILDMNFKDMPQADVWTYGAPCQAFSIAGKQLGMDFKCPNCGHVEQFEGEMIIDRITPCSECGTQSEPKDVRGILFFEVMRLLKETNAAQPENLPPVIMLENVKGISKFLDVVAYEYEKRGYKLYQTLYNSKFWGLAQNRERYFVVGVHESIDKEFKFPVQQEDYIPRLSAFLDPVVDEKYYIDDLKALKIIEQAKEGLKVKQATKKGYDIAVEGDAINVAHPDSKTRRGRVGKQVVQTLLTGQEQVVVEQQGVLLSKQATILNKFIDQTGTLMARDYKGFGNQEMAGVLDNYRVRKLTEREYLRLQGFPEDFEIVCSPSQTYKQAGNAVSVPVARAIAERIRMFLLSL